MPEVLIYKVHRGWLVVHYINKPSYENGGSIHSVFVEDPAHQRMPKLVKGEED